MHAALLVVALGSYLLVLGAAGPGAVQAYRAAPANGCTIVVDTLVDGENGAGCSLRNAIDAGANGCPGPYGTPLSTDQRGLTRPVDGDADGTARCDIGAYERQWQWLCPPLPMSAGTTPVRSERFSADRVHPRIPKSPLRSLRYQAGHTRHLPLAQH